VTREAVEAVIDAYQDAVRRGDVDSYVALFDPEVFWGREEGEPVRSLEALRDAISGMFSRATLSPAFTIEHLDLDGNTAVVVAHEGGVVRVGEGDERRMNLTELFVLRRHDSTWKITRQVWNRRSPAAR